MTSEIPRLVQDRYDDITVELHAAADYAFERPSFEEFAEFYEILTREFYHNAVIMPLRLVDDPQPHIDKTTAELQVEWEKIKNWVDLEEYVSDWIADRLGIPR